MNPVTIQPGANMNGTEQWMTMPNIGNCPPGLEYLSSLDQVICKQKVELVEAITGFNTNNKYKIMNNMGQKMYTVLEETGFCMRMWCQSHRAFDMHVYDNNQQEVMRIRRPFVCCGDCCWCASCCGFKVIVEAPAGNVIGVVKLRSSCWKYEFDVCDADENPVFEILGPCCTCKCCSDVEFPIYSKSNHQEVGSIAKQWTGMAKELLTNADNFSVQFPQDLDVKMKATLVGALFFIDFMAFEQEDNNNSSGDG